VSIPDATEIRLINQVVVHFGYLPPEQAVSEVANHVRKFWDPRMRRRLFDLVDSRASDLEPVALAAAALLR
jgi:formate dehydrogenase subunit delta